MANEPIPFLDLVTPHRELEEELLDAFRQALRAAAFIGGAEVDAFEQEFAAYCGAKHCVGVANGTDAVRFALMASGVGRGDAVVTVSHTFIATVEAISQAGADAEFVDIDAQTYCMSPDALDDYLSGCVRESGKRKAARETHWQADQGHIAGASVRPGRRHGRDSFDRGELQPPRDRGRLSGTRRGVSVGGRSVAQGRNVRQGGRVQLLPGQEPGRLRGGRGGDHRRRADRENDQDAARARAGTKYYHDLEGYNGRLDAVQAAVLRIKLRHLDNWNAQRRAAAVRYTEQLSSMPGVIRAVRARAQQGCLSSLCHSKREPRCPRGTPEISGRLLRVALSTSPPLTEVLPRDWAMRRAALPVTERAAAEILSLPMFPGLKPAQQLRVASAIQAFEEVGAF